MAIELKGAVLAKLHRLLDVPEANTSWAVLVDDLRRVNTVALSALLDRVRRARRESYSQGRKNYPHTGERA